MASEDSEQLAQEQFENSCSHPPWLRQDTCSSISFLLLGRGITSPASLAVTDGYMIEFWQ